MRFSYLVCLLLASFAFGQTGTPVTPPAAGATTQPGTPAAQAPESTVGPDDPVITLKGLCTDTSLQGDACKTVVTRAQFEKLAEALQPKMPPVMRRQLASRYSTMLKMSTEAEKRGLDKDPRFEEMMISARMSLLSQQLSRALQEDAAKVSDNDIDDYYKKNEASYEQATFARIFVPRTKQFPPAVSPKTAATAGARAGATTAAPQPLTEAQKKAAEAAMNKLANTLRARAVAGEDPDKLQKEAYTAAGMPGNSANTKMERVRRTTVPANQQVAMNLNPGEVSEVIADPNSGYYIYKMVSKETLPLDSVKVEIRNTITSQRYRDSMQAFQGNVDLNDSYFGPTRKPGPPPATKGPTLPTEENEDPD
jgi:parvulin-like peptidyl-prolyl isomerase